MSARPSNHDTSDTQALIKDVEQEFPENKLIGKYWTSIWLRKPTLFALIALFTALVASLVVLLTVDQAHNGIRPTLSSNHYAWTYGPTAVLVIVLSLWRQVDYYCKLMQPWQEMHNSPKDADNSLMLDYIPPILMSSWLRAVHRPHIPVAASIAGFTIMKLIILFSTGLLVLTPTVMTRSQPITFTTSFTMDEFWKTVPEGGIVTAKNENKPTYSKISTDSVHAYIKALEGEDHGYNMSLDNTILQSFEVQRTPGLLGVITDLDAFIPNVSCEIARSTFDEAPDYNLVVRLASTTCSVGAKHQTLLELVGSTGFCDFIVGYCPPSVVLFNCLRVNCSEVDDSSLNTTIDISTPYDFRFALLVGNYTVETGSTGDGSPLAKAVPLETAAVICKIDYSMNKATVLHNSTDGSTRVDHLVAVGHLNNLTGMMLGEIMHDALWVSQDLSLPITSQHFDLKTNPQTTMPLYSVLLRTLDGELSMDRFLSVETLQSSAREIWAGIASQFVRENGIRAATVTSNATVTFVESRLHVGLISLWAMIAGFILLIMLTVCIMFTTCNDVVPHDPGYVAMSSSVMITSSTLTDILSACGELRTSQLSSALSGFEFKTQFDHSFQIVGAANRLGSSKKKIEKEENQKATTWIPLAAQYPMIGLTFIVPVLAIVVLEILYRNSHRSRGLLDVFDTERMAIYLSRYISSSIVLLIATLFNSLNFAVASFAPYSLLRSGAVPGGRSLCFNLLGKLAPMALLKSVEAHHVSSVFSNTAGMIGSILTIVSSGLWVIDHTVTTGFPITASLADNWDVSWYNSSRSGDGGAVVTFDSFQHGGTALPSLSWHNIVFPKIAVIRLPPSGDTLGDPITQNLTIQLEGLRPQLDCEVVTNDHLSIDYFTDPDGDDIVISVRAPLPPGCQHTGMNGTDSYYEITPAFEASDRWLGRFFDLHLGPWAETVDPEWGETTDNLDIQKDNPAGCPSIGVLFVANHAQNTSYDDVSALLCSQKIENVKLNVSYLGHGLMHPTINTNLEPVIISGAAEYLTNGTKGFESFPYCVQTYLQNLTRFGIGSLKDVSYTPLDQVMDHLIHGPNGTAPEDLAGKANREKLIEAVQTLYTRYMIFVIDQRFRQPIARNSTEGINQLTGTAYRYTSRLQMNSASKLTLQIMLATMTLLGAAAFYLTDLRGTLPRKPTTIVSQLALFAGSDMCDEKKPLIPRDALWKQGKELDRVFDGWLFSLGWWPKTRKSGGVVSEGGGEMSADALLEGKEVEGRRFGIDVGVAEQLGFR